MDFTIRAATLEDCKDIARMIMELAEYEKIADCVKITQKDLEQDGFSKNPFFHGIIPEVPEQLRTKNVVAAIERCQNTQLQTSQSAHTDP